MAGVVPTTPVNPSGLFPSLDHGFSQGVVARGTRTLYVSGQVAWDAQRRLIGGADLGALLQLGSRPDAQGRTRTVVVVRSAQQRIAVHVDEVLGNQEVVVKNLGPQLSRLPGLAGMTLLASGAVALIYNPVALATLYGEVARSAMAPRVPGAPVSPSLPAEASAALTAATPSARLAAGCAPWKA